MKTLSKQIELVLAQFNTQVIPLQDLEKALDTLSNANGVYAYIGEFVDGQIDICVDYVNTSGFLRTVWINS